jgi:WD40 repeat protein
MEFNAAGNCIAKQLKNKVELLDCTTGALIKEIYHGGKKILDMRCNAAESCIATRSKTKVKLSDCTTGTLIKEIDHGGQIIVDMKFNTAGTSIATRTLSEIKLFDYETGMLIKEIDIEGLIRDMVFHPSGTCIAVLSSHGSWCSKPQYKVKLFDCITGAFIKVIDKVIDPDIEHSVSIEFNAAGNRIATQKLCRVGSQVKIWDLSDLQSIKNLERNLLIFETLNLLTLSNACRDKIRTEEDYALLKTMPSALQECFDVDESLKNMDIDTKGSK